jgi:DNA-binding GntR family transcriptional regulator
MQSILDFLQGWRGTKFKSSEIAKKIGISPHGISPGLHSLHEQGLIEMENTRNTKVWHCKTVVVAEPGAFAQSRTVDWKPLGIYNLKQHMDACEASRSLKNGGLI